MALCVPNSMSDAQLRGAVQYRSRGRIPALSWRHPMNGAPLCRASQPMSGLRGLTGLSMSTVCSFILLFVISCFLMYEYVLTLIEST